MMNSRIYEKILKKVRDKEVVLWVGAGFSRSAGFPLGMETIELIKKNCTDSELVKLQGINSLPDFCDRFVKLRGGRKNDLINILENIFNINIDNDMLKTHIKLKNIPQIDTIITTNYDELLESSYGKGNVRIIRKDKDISAIDNNKIKIYKIHGDFNSREDIVITRKDYTNFFGDKMNSLLWNHIRTIVSQKNILFIGYALGDQNVDYLFTDMIERLGEFTKESFVVAPNLSDEDIDELKRANISYIDTTGEAFILKLEKDIKDMLLEDVKKELVTPKKTKEIFEREGLDVKFKISDSGICRLSTIGQIDDQEVDAKINFKFKNPEIDKGEEFVEVMKGLNDRIVGKNLDGFEIDGKYIEQFDSKFNGIDVFSKAKDSNYISSKLIIIPHPDERVEYDMYIGEDLIEKVVIERYRSRYMLKTCIISSVFEMCIKWNIKEMEENQYILDESGQKNVKIKFATNILENNKVFKVLSRWLEGENLNFFRTDDYSDQIELPYDKSSGELNEVIIKNEFIFSTLLLIQKYFKVSLDKVEKITYNDLNNMCLLRKYCENNGKLKCNEVRTNLERVLELRNDNKEIKLTDKSEVINIFNKDFDLGTPVIIDKEIFIDEILNENIAVIKSNSECIDLIYYKETK